MVSEEAGIDFIDGGEIRHVPDKHHGFYNIGLLKARLPENRFLVLQGLPGLGFNALRQRAGCGIQPQLSGGKEHVSGLDGLGVGADGGRGVHGLDGFCWHFFYSPFPVSADIMPKKPGRVNFRRKVDDPPRLWYDHSTIPVME